MTSTPFIIVMKRSGQNSDRPSGTIVQGGELALSFGATDPGLYFEDSAGAVRKIGPAGYGTTAPNASPVGLAGNSVGEQWTDATAGLNYLKVWTGGAWVKISAGFSDSATVASSATIAGSAQTCTLASGAVLASGAIGARLASGCIQASGAVLASGSIGSLLASGCIQASGAVLASGAVRGSTVVLSGLPNPVTQPSGAMYYQIQSSGTFNAGLYVRALDTWLLT